MRFCLKNLMHLPKNAQRHPNDQVPAPNNSFKPNLLRYGKGMAGKACHTFASTTQVGLTPALGLKGESAVLREIDGVPVLAKHRATCHCGSVELELDLPQGIVNPRRCDCSICRRKGAVVASVSLGGIRIVKGSEHLKLYEFNTHTAKHYFCGKCGIYTHHQRRSNPDEYGFNVGCLEGINPFAIPDVPVNDGINHPADRAEA